MSNEAKPTLEELLKLMHFDDAQVEERPLDDGLLLDHVTLVGANGRG